ncbi:ATP-binding protein [Bacillus sp. JJ1122]|uniref:ATP-binding protein n=1 Tax=Bacillus sp. JJ1122 TaxID=3122951 RepID=UPI002FFE5B9A
MVNSNFIFGKDPLELKENQNDNISSYFTEISKREIKNILKSYVSFFDPFSELIQNAMDSVDRRKKILNEDGYQKRLWITVDLKNNTFSVTDNGMGFSEKELGFFAPNVSFNKNEDERGNKGVGATFVAYGYNYIQVGSKSSDFNFLAELTNGRNWVNDTTNDVSRPVFQETTLIDSSFKDIDRGATFSIKFGGSSGRPKDLSWLNADKAFQWKSILMIKTPLGQINTGGSVADNEKIGFSLKVIDKSGNEDSLKEIEDAEYIYPHKVIDRSKDISEIIKVRSKLAEKGDTLDKLKPQYKNLNAVYKFYHTRDLIAEFSASGNSDDSQASQDSEEESLLKEYTVTAYGFFCYSRKVWDTYNDELLKIRKGQRIISGGIQLATNNMPQGELIAIPLTFETGYQYQTHVIVHFIKADPDLGRKGFQPELVNLAQQIGVKIVNFLKGYRKAHLMKDGGGKPKLKKQAKKEQWIEDQKNYETANPLIIKHEKFFLPTKEISITSLPRSEQDVIVLFNQLVAGGVIRGIKLLATSQHQQYDGIFRFSFSKPKENHIFDKESNPLGITNEMWEDDLEKGPTAILEYKQNVDALLEEFENGEKDEKDIYLVVAWDIGMHWKEKYNVVSYLDLDNYHHRIAHGITHAFMDDYNENPKMYGIILSELVSYLNDLEKEQENQRNKYNN